MAKGKDEAAQLYAEAISIDGLNCSNWGREEAFRSLHNGGLTAINATIVFWESFQETLDNIANWLGWFEEYGDILTQVRTAADIHRAKAQDRVGIIFGWQNAAPIENDLKRLRLFHTLGVRIIQITYNERNLLGNGCYERVDDGLSNFGQAAVREMNRLGILIDLSHVGDRTTLETIDLSEQPVAITHANARSFKDHPRNKTDEAIRRMAEKGGVIGANAFPTFLPREYESTLEDLIDSIDYLVGIVGIDHVGVGTDFCQSQPRAFFEWLFSQQGKIPPNPLPVPYPLNFPEGLETPDEFSNIARALLERGYRAEDVKKVIGGNWLRLLSQVWQE